MQDVSAEGLNTTGGRLVLLSTGDLHLLCMMDSLFQVLTCNTKTKTILCSPRGLLQHKLPPCRAGSAGICN